MFDQTQALEHATRNKEQRQFPTDVIDLVCKVKALVNERDKLENERETKRDIYLKVITVVILLTVNKEGLVTEVTELTGAIEMTQNKKPCPGPNQLEGQVLVIGIKKGQMH
jgi:hypothetical protein